MKGKHTHSGVPPVSGNRPPAKLFVVTEAAAASRRKASNWGRSGIVAAGAQIAPACASFDEVSH